MRRPSAIARAPRQPHRQRRHAGARLQRIARRHQQPHLVQPQPPQRQCGDVPMPRMRRIERAAEQADAHPPPVAEPRQRIHKPRAQGRTWPVPRTT